MIVASERLRLVPVASEHADILHRIWTDADVRRYLWDDAVIPREVAQAVVDSTVADWQQRGYGLWLIEEQGSVVGFCGFRSSEESDEPELLYGLLPTAWHRGIATEAARAALAFLFSHTNLQAVRAATDVPNAPSARVLERLGMTVVREEEVEGRPTRYYRMTAIAAGARSQ